MTAEEEVVPFGNCSSLSCDLLLGQSLKCGISPRQTAHILCFCTNTLPQPVSVMLPSSSAAAAGPGRVPLALLSGGPHSSSSPGQRVGVTRATSQEQHRHFLWDTSWVDHRSPGLLHVQLPLWVQLSLYAPLWYDAVMEQSPPRD